ncbi:MAG: PQQ-dependent sugar dehydrogenase [Saprospiraceae bacterium]|nr:PQQ-dependent sugar dehydrogenase [Saprospiraceae bacterium]
MNKALPYIVFSLLMLPMLSCSQDIDFPSSPLQISYEPINTDFNNPWSFLFLPDGSMLVTEKTGELYHVIDGVKNPQPIAGLPDIYVRGQGGLMDLELHPNYEENGWIYLSYGFSTNNQKGGNTTVARARLSDHTLTDFSVIFKASPVSRKGQHWGGRLEFDTEGFLYISVGDRGARDENPQTLDNSNGKIHRIHDDGTIPTDNPFVGQASAVSSIFSYGHRNPQGLALQKSTGLLWSHEHGPKGGDELNVIRAGNNYGWPVITYGRNYSGTIITKETEREGMEQPSYYWVPSIAPCGMTFVDSDIYPEWQGSVLIGSLKFNYIHRCTIDGETIVAHEKVVEDIGRVRTVRQGPDGYIYASVEGKGLFKLIPEVR